MSVKTLNDADVQAAFRGEGEFPEGTFINFFNPDKLTNDGRSVEELIARATGIEPGTKSAKARPAAPKPTEGS